MDYPKFEGCFYHNVKEKYYCSRCRKALCEDCVKIIDIDNLNKYFCHPCYYEYLKNPSYKGFVLLPVIILSLLGTILLFSEGRFFDAICVIIFFLIIPLYYGIKRPIKLERARKKALKYDSGAYQLDENFKKL
ncbi:MAG: hypothetical protein ACTSRK_16995 [Promethearchaeota archaeon]